jgi:hypothetical protein
MPLVDIDLSRVWPKAGFYFPVGRTLHNSRNRTSMPMFGKDRRARKVYYAICHPDVFNYTAATASGDGNTKINYPTEKNKMDQAFAELMSKATFSVHMLQIESVFGWFKLVGNMTQWTKDRLHTTLVSTLVVELVTARATYKERVSQGILAAVHPEHECASAKEVDKFVEKLEEVMSGKHLRLIYRFRSLHETTQQIKDELFTKVWASTLGDVLKNWRISTGGFESGLESGLEEKLHALVLEEDDGLDAEENENGGAKGLEGEGGDTEMTGA